MYTLIKQIFDGIEEIAANSYYGRKILAAYRSYGARYEFCRFYSCENAGGGAGLIHVYYGSMVIDGEIDVSEAESFIKMIQPINVEISEEYSLNIAGYRAVPRTLFRVVPHDTELTFDTIAARGNLMSCYKILREGFEDMSSFDSWYVDISHRIRHKTAEIYLWENSTVTKAFDIDGYVFLSHIATAAEARGQGRARKMLYCIAGQLAAEGKTGYLFALEHRRSFYESIGFTPAGKDIIYLLDNGGELSR